MKFLKLEDMDNQIVYINTELISTLSQRDNRTKITMSNSDVILVNVPIEEMRKHFISSHSITSIC